MKHTIYLIAITSLFNACKQNVANEAATEVTTENTTIPATADSTDVTVNEPTISETTKLELTPLRNSDDLEPDDGENYQFSQNGKSIIEFNNKIIDINNNKVNGKIILNGKTYKLNKSVRIGDSGYTISGDEVVINIPTIKWLDDNDGGDCQEGKVPILKITLEGKNLELNNVKVNYCYLG